MDAEGRLHEHFHIQIDTVEDANLPLTPRFDMRVRALFVWFYD